MIQIQTNGLCICMLSYIFSQFHNGWSQTRYLIICGSTMVSWRYMKQTIVATSSNHTELQEKLWIYLANVYNSTCARNLWLSPTKMESTTIYEDNSVLFNWKDDIDIQKFINVKIWQVYLWSFCQEELLSKRFTSSDSITLIM